MKLSIFVNQSLLSIKQQNIYSVERDARNRRDVVV